MFDQKVRHYILKSFNLNYFKENIVSNTQISEKIKTPNTQLGLIIKAFDMPVDTLEVKRPMAPDEIPPEVKDKLEHMKPWSCLEANAPELSRTATATSL